MTTQEAKPAATRIITYTFKSTEFGFEHNTRKYVAELKAGTRTYAAQINERADPQDPFLELIEAKDGSVGAQTIKIRKSDLMKLVDAAMMYRETESEATD